MLHPQDDELELMEINMWLTPPADRGAIRKVEEI
jgi:hypothetical protein